MQPSTGKQRKCRRETPSPLAEYPDAELPTATCEEIEAHVGDGPARLKLFESLKRAIGLCRELGRPEPPGALGQSAGTGMQGVYERMFAARR